jgi:hypothetical protein
MEYVRVNKLLRASGLTAESLAELMGLESINCNAKLGIIDNIEREEMTVHADMDSDTLIALRNAINAELEVRLAVLKREYLSFKEQVKP